MLLGTARAKSYPCIRHILRSDLHHGRHSPLLLRAVLQDLFRLLINLHLCLQAKFPTCDDILKVQLRELMLKVGLVLLALPGRNVAELLVNVQDEI